MSLEILQSIEQAEGQAEQVRSEARTIPMLARRLRAIEADVDELSDLVAKEVEGDETYRCLLTVPGVGRSTAAQLVAAVQVGAFAGNDKLASYCGLTPRDTRSGATINSTSPSPEGNRCLKNLLIFTCLSLVRSDNEFGRYYRACRSRGMRHTAALKATAPARANTTADLLGPYERSVSAHISKTTSEQTRGTVSEATATGRPASAGSREIDTRVAEEATAVASATAGCFESRKPGHSR